MKLHKSVSVIIPTYNRFEFLPKAIESVLNQTYSFIELLIVDDGSTDQTADLIPKYQDQTERSVIYIYQENKGPASARNNGIRQASGEYLAFLDSDDWFHEKKIAWQLEKMMCNPEMNISHTQEVWYRRGKLLNQKAKHRKESGSLFERCLELCAVGMSTVMVKKDFLDSVGYFDESMPCCEDYDLWLRMSIKYPFLLIDEPLTFKRGGRPDQVSTIHRIGIDKYRIQAIEKILQSGSLTPQQYELAAMELKRKCTIYGNGCLKHKNDEQGKYYLSLPEKYGSTVQQ